MLDHETDTRPLTTSEELCSALMAAQSVIGVLLWSTYYSWPEARSWLELTPEWPEVTDGFFVGDMVAIVASLIAAWAIRARKPWAVLVVAFTTGLILYPTAYLVSWVTSTDGVAVGAFLVMIPPAIINPWVLHRTWKTRRI